MRIDRGFWSELKTILKYWLKGYTIIWVSTPIKAFSQIRRKNFFVVRAADQFAAAELFRGRNAPPYMSSRYFT